MAAAAAALSSSLHARLLLLAPNPSPTSCFAPRAARGRPPRHRRFAKPPSRNGSSSPETEWCPVPPEQRPVNEYEALAESLPFSWAAGDLRLYCSRLALTGAAVALFVGLPVAAFGSRGVPGGADGVHLALGATGSGILAVTLAVVRMYLGWAYVGNRLLSATVEYEETGWYDGQYQYSLHNKWLKGLIGYKIFWRFKAKPMAVQKYVGIENLEAYGAMGATNSIWVKTPEVLARDRLLGSFSVKPVLNRVKFTLVGLAVSLIVCILLYINTEKPKEPYENTSGRAIPGVYSDAAARSFEPDAFCGEPDLS